MCRLSRDNFLMFQQNGTSARNTVAFQEQEREVQEMRRHLGACVHVRLTIENIWVSQGKVLTWVRLDVKYLYSI